MPEWKHTFFFVRKTVKTPKTELFQKAHASLLTVKLCQVNGCFILHQMDFALCAFCFLRRMIPCFPLVADHDSA